MLPQSHGVAIALMLLCQLASLDATSQVGIDSDGMLDAGGGMSLEELAGFGVIDGGVMEEVQRLAALDRTAAVQAIISGTSALAVSHTPESWELQQHVESFEASMQGETFLSVEDTPLNARYRRALFIAACRTLANEARARGRG